MVYDRIAERYDRLMAPLERAVLRRWRREALDTLPTDARILEVGAGTGANFEFYPINSIAVATEISIGMLGRARDRATGINLVQASVEELPFASNSFDAAFATLVFCSVKDPLKGMLELKRIVRPGGTVVLLEHVRPEGALGYAFDAFNVISTAVIEDCFNRRTSEIVSAVGLTIEKLHKKALGAVNLIVCRRAKG